VYARWSVKQLIEHHQTLYARLHVQDVYKLLYQAAFGVEHLLTDSAHVSGYLLRELASVDASGTDEALMERISLEDDVIRVNLRPFKALNLSADSLVQVMFLSARETTPDTAVFSRQWNEFSALARYGLLNVPGDVELWDDRVERREIVPVHHSPEYSGAHRPAYRVVRRKLFESVFGVK
jgi:hypothetical protein